MGCSRWDGYHHLSSTGANIRSRIVGSFHAFFISIDVMLTTWLIDSSAQYSLKQQEELIAELDRWKVDNNEG